MLIHHHFQRVLLGSPSPASWLCSSLCDPAELTLTQACHSRQAETPWGVSANSLAPHLVALSPIPADHAAVSHPCGVLHRARLPTGTQRCQRGNHQLTGVGVVGTGECHLRSTTMGLRSLDTSSAFPCLGHWGLLLVSPGQCPIHRQGVLIQGSWS